MNAYPWSALTPALRASIEAQPRVAHPGRYEHSDDRECGCHERAGGWWLCLYHDGFQDAEAIMLGMIERLATNQPSGGSYPGMASRFVPCPLGARCLTGARTHDPAGGQYRECAAAQTGAANPTRPAAAAAAASARPVDADEALHVELDGEPAKDALLGSLNNAEGWACAAVIAAWVTARRGGPNVVDIEPDSDPDASPYAVLVSVTAPNGARLAAWDDMGGLLIDADSDDDVFDRLNELVTGLETKARETDW